MNAQALEQAIKAVCPIDGVAIGDWADRNSWRVDAAADATAEQIQAAAAVVAGWDPHRPTPDDVRAECRRRMRDLVAARDDRHLDLIISNGTREAVALQAIRLGMPGVEDPREWTAEEATRAATLTLAARQLDALRARSNAMEAAPPADYAADARWM